MPEAETDRAPLRLLFVDDEPNVLAGLRRMLYPERELWSAKFAAGGAEALDMLAREAFDVVVSDMRMPGMDGAEVLSRVREVDPGVVRIVLSGQTDQRSAVRAANVAHQFLTKPTDPDALKAAVNRGQQLAHRLAAPVLRAVLGRLDRLPSASATLHRLNAVLEDPAASVAAVASIVEKDLGLCAKFLQVVNSGFFALPAEVSSVHEAVSHLGLPNVGALATSAESFESWGAGGEVEELAAELQSHSMAVVQLARYVLPCARLPSDLFLGALLHDIGVLVAALLAVQELSWTSKVGAAKLPDSERAALGANHADVGAYLVCLWGLPYGAVEVVSRHHDPELPVVGSLTEAHAVFVAEALVSEVRELPGHPPRPVALDELGLGSPAQLDDWRRYRDTLIRG